MSSKNNYIIYTGNVYPHKNIPVLLAALKKLPDLKLIIVCGRSVFADRTQKMVREMDLTGRVDFKYLVSDTELLNLYKQANCFVTPSLIEGFGLPGLEAMAAGIPVIAANASCLPEIYGDAALYFDPYNPQDLADKINSLTPEIRKQLIAAGKNRVTNYSWSKMASETWQIYQKELH